MEMVEEGQKQPKISQKRIELEDIVEEGGEDRISALQDCLLLEILSRLPSTEGAIRTSTLSKRWEHLWTSLPNLRFRYYDDNRPLSDFVSFVDKTLSQCRHLKLKRLYVRRTDSEVKLFDQNFFTSSFLTELRLWNCMYDPTEAISWKNLRYLRIGYARLDEDLIENILSGSPELETFVLEDCYGFSFLDITSKSVNLVLTGYRNSKPEYAGVGDVIKINAPNILSLTIDDCLEMRKLLLLNVASLVEANLDYVFITYLNPIPKKVKAEMLKEIITNLHYVKELNIGMDCYKLLNRLKAKGFTIPSNIKFLPSAYHWSDRYG
ncbi:unnamed protein product [Lactuca saligna]|uniref:F-box domain-containing protein n=1 Tax=Lactuca saligna TaxID=75948 RepID=A0AA35ZHQ2_LACSI|nr:unnamed protein product [Lactuca saligna]